MINQYLRALRAVEDKHSADYNLPMTIELSHAVEEQLRDLAKRQNRDVAELIEDAVRQYLETVAITDVDASQIAVTQAALLSELPPVSKWETDDA